MVYGYTRESTDGQEGTSQRAEIREKTGSIGMIVDEWIVETEPANGERKMHELMHRIGAGDMIAVTDLSRIGRSMRDIYSLVGNVTDRGAAIWAVRGGQRVGAGMDAAGAMLCGVLGMAAEIERELISERTRSGLRAAKAAGKRLGRPHGVSKLDAKASEIARLRELGVNKADVARIVGCSRSTLALWLSRRKPEVQGSWKTATLSPAMPTAVTMELADAPPPPMMLRV